MNPNTSVSESLETAKALQSLTTKYIESEHPEDRHLITTMIAIGDLLELIDAKLRKEQRTVKPVISDWAERNSVA